MNRQSRTYSLRFRAGSAAAAGKQEARSLAHRNAEEAQRDSSLPRTNWSSCRVRNGRCAARIKCASYTNALTTAASDVSCGFTLSRPHARASNVLLADADIPYTALRHGNVNGMFLTTDLALVIGANDVTNPAARTDASSPIFGKCPFLTWTSRPVMVINASWAPVFAELKTRSIISTNASCSSAPPHPS